MLSFKDWLKTAPLWLVCHKTSTPAKQRAEYKKYCEQFKDAR